jgi:hypothetical protein
MSNATLHRGTTMQVSWQRSALSAMDLPLFLRCTPDLSSYGDPLEIISAQTCLEVATVSDHDRSIAVGARVVYN